MNARQTYIGPRQYIAWASALDWLGRFKGRLVHLKHVSLPSNLVYPVHVFTLDKTMYAKRHACCTSTSSTCCIEELDRYTLQHKMYKHFILCEFWFIELTLRA